MAGYLRLRQICLAVPTLEPSLTLFEQALGLAVCYRDPAVATYGLENVVIPIASSFLELVAPIAPDTAAARFIERSQGRGAYMVIFDCDDPDRRGAHAEALSVPIVSRHQHGGFRGVQLHPKACRAAMLELDHTDGGDDPLGAYGPAGGTGWTQAIRSQTTRRLMRIRVESPQPDELAAHWSRLLETPVSGRVLPTQPVDIELVEASAGTREAVTELVLDVADPDRVVGAARALGTPFEHGSPVVGGVRLVLRQA